MTVHDRLFKQLFETFFGDLVRITLPWLAARMTDAPPELITEELRLPAPARSRDGPVRRPDLLARLRLRGRRQELVLVHVEVESRRRPGMARRMRTYAQMARLIHRRPVVPLVVYLSDGTDPPGGQGRGRRSDAGADGSTTAAAAPEPGRESLGPDTPRPDTPGQGPSGRGTLRKETLETRVGGEVLEVFHYYAFHLARNSAEDLLARPEPLSWGLAALTRSRDLGALDLKVRCAESVLTDDGLTAEQRHVLLDCIHTYLPLEEDDQVDYERHIREIGEAMGLPDIERTAFEQREYEGWQKGRLEAVRRVLLRLMEFRFGNLDLAIRREVEAEDSIEVLEGLAEKVLVADSPRAMGLGGSD